jgi:hypothetical protein
MTLAAVANFERVIDRLAPAVLLALGLASAGAMALIGGRTASQARLLPAGCDEKGPSGGPFSWALFAWRVRGLPRRHTGLKSNLIIVKIS